ncbi:sigma-70 family RNA polymerase sigma factor [Streptomyces lomondensis]|nr:sigma-70 family RNA polymerase sigma factor [Streptomyces lomondensis]MCF0077573.1 sigma-70 family RNA polymerase sigma factor [Streptomyces lomondensis]
MLVAEVRSAGTPTVGGGVPAARERSGADAEMFVRAVYAQHGRVLLRYAARRLRGDWHRAEDILQEAVVRAWRHGGALGRAPETMRPWLFAVVRNLLIDDHRAQALRPVAQEALDDTDVPVADEVNRLLTGHVVTEALEDLTDQQREILRHMYFDGSSVAEVSVLLGVPRGTVKSRTYYAMRALHRALAARGVHG